jgi:hypothetical protein
VHFRPLRSLAALTFASALFLGLAPSAGAAGGNDKEAQKLYDSAINDDYLGAEFAKAEKKLKDALTKCGSNCSPEMVGKIHVAMGTVYSVGLSKNDDAKTEFAAALKADPKATLSADLSTPDLVKLFDEVKKSTGGSKPSVEPKAGPEPRAPTADGGHTPPAESPVNTPLPIYIEPADDVPLSKVILRYKPFGATQFKSVELKKTGKGYGGEIPCEDVTTTGDVKYFFAFTGADGEAAGGLGSTKEPFKTTIKNEIEGDAPKLPGKKAPEQCKEKADCPPGLPGCDSGKKHGDKGWGSSCEAASECKDGLTCLNGTCEEDKGSGGDTGGGGGGDDGQKKKRMNLVGVVGELDFLVIKGGSSVCDGTNVSYVCYLQGTAHQFFGVPVPYPADKSIDSITGGGKLGGARILAVYERQLLKKIGLVAGVRLGYAFGGPPLPDNLVNGNPPLLTTPAAIMLNNGHAGPQQSTALGFHGFHGEARLAYYLLGSMMDDKKLRPFVFVGGGTGQVNGSVPVALCDANYTSADAGSKQCPGTSHTSVVRQATAYQITGLGFVDFGAGTTFGITPLFGISAEVKFMFMVPTFGVVVAPTLGPVFNF